jgi:hypothetical protein
MKLSEDQLQEYQQRGFLFFPSLLTDEEMGVLRKALDRIVEVPRREIVCEKDGKTSGQSSTCRLMMMRMPDWSGIQRFYSPLLRCSEDPLMFSS